MKINWNNRFLKNALATARAATTLVALPVFIGMIGLQTLVVGPILRNRSLIPNLLFRSFGKLFGYKIKFSTASAPLVKDKNKRVWFVANHMSNTDFITAGIKLPGSFVGKGEILKTPVVAQFAQSTKFIGIRRSKKYNAESRGKLVQAFNAGQNTIMFPEATTTEGKKVYLFHAGLMTLLFGDKAVDEKQREVTLKNDVVVQPVAIQIKSVNGHNAADNDSLRKLYGLREEPKFLKRIWKRFQVKNITLELTAFDALNPKDFENAKDLANAAASKVVTVINPGQTEFENAFKPETWGKPPVWEKPALSADTPSSADKRPKQAPAAPAA